MIGFKYFVGEVYTPIHTYNPLSPKRRIYNLNHLLCTDHPSQGDREKADNHLDISSCVQPSDISDRSHPSKKNQTHLFLHI